ncbi:hypothetical protein [Legionella fairfieldensis]|uniref:hypothetical protein n=1 Tax=Legionella fairfieldensis TaxID=45064 RepID=UPI00048A9827|nr:hypothetical protein [Legionella fairfieldensis]
MMAFQRFFNWYIPNELKKILEGVKNNTLTHIAINKELIKKFGDYSYREKNCPRYFQSLAKELLHNTSVISITVSGYGFPNGMEYVIEALKSNSQVKNLSLEISTDAYHKHLLALISMLPHNTGLEKLSFYISDNGAALTCFNVIDSLKQNQTLKTLEIDRFYLLDKKSIEALIALPQFNYTLQELTLLKETNLSERSIDRIRPVSKRIFFPSKEQVKALVQNDKDNYLHCLPEDVLDYILHLAGLHHNQKEFQHALLSKHNYR